MAWAIRRAGPEDVEFVSWAIVTSQRGHLSRGWFDIALDRSPSECLAFVRRLAAAQTHSWWHASRFLIGEMNGDAATALCVLRADGATSAAQQAVEEVARDMGLDDGQIALIGRRGAYVGTCWMLGDDDACVIEHVATWPLYRRRGLSVALIENALAVGGALGCKVAQITFYIGNEAAEKTYSKAGFRFVEERRSAYFQAMTGAAGLRRYVRNI